MQGMRAIED